MTTGRIRGLLATLLLTLLAAAPAEAAYPGRNGAIAFTGPVMPGAGEQIHVVGADGSGARQVTSTMFVDKAAWSPDGRALRIHGRGTNSIWPVRSRPDAAVTFGEPVSGISGGREFGYGPLTWSPDGAQIAAHYHGGYGEAHGFAPQGLYVLDPATAGTLGPDEVARRGRLLTRDGGADPVWSPDGSVIAHTGCRHEQPSACGLFLTRTDSSADGTQLLLRQSDHWPTFPIRSPDWSPDGRRLIFEVGNLRGVGMGLWSVRADGTGLGMVRASGWSPAYSPDGRRIAYSQGDGLYVADSSGANPRKVFTGSNLEPDWQRLAPVGPRPVDPAPTPSPPPAPVQQEAAPRAPAAPAPAPTASPVPAAGPATPGSPAPSGTAAPAPRAGEPLRAALRLPRALRPDRRGVLRVVVECPAGAGAGCTGELKLRAGGRALVARSFAVRPAAVAIVRLPLRARDRAALRRARVIRATLALRGPDAAGTVRQTTTRVALRPR